MFDRSVDVELLPGTPLRSVKGTQTQIVGDRATLERSAGKLRWSYIALPWLATG
jgi:hypothetical protein